MQTLAYLSAPAYLLGYIPETGSAGSEDVLQTKTKLASSPHLCQLMFPIMLACPSELVRFVQWQPHSPFR